MSLLPRLAARVTLALATVATLIPAGCSVTTWTLSEEKPTYAREIPYHGDTKGHLVFPTNAGGPKPGVVMIHEWWGLNDQIKEKADELAQKGYIVLAVDLFNGKVAKTPQEAQALVQALDQNEAIANMKDAVAFLRARNYVTQGRIATLGWCFGGGQALKLAQAQPGLAALVMYYGSVDTDPLALKGLPPILGIFGAADAAIPLDQVKVFDAALTQAGVPHEIHTYPGAPHAFANPTNTTAYRAEAAADAWAKTLDFLKAKLQ
jgi:carboxymethylenebutenolidase